MVVSMDVSGSSITELPSSQQVCQCALMTRASSIPSKLMNELLWFCLVTMEQLYPSLCRLIISSTPLEAPNFAMFSGLVILDVSFCELDWGSFDLVRSLLYLAYFPCL